MTHRDVPNDRVGVLARARAARFEAERLEQIAFQARIEAVIANVRAELVPLSPVIEAQLHLRLSKPVPDIL